MTGGVKIARERQTKTRDEIMMNEAQQKETLEFANFSRSSPINTECANTIHKQ